LLYKQASKEHPEGIMASTKTRRPRKTAATTAERAAKVAALRDRLAEWEGDADEAMIGLALALAKRDGYSDRNAKLIVMQCPTATDVAGYKAWIDRGRHVRSGEHGIQILAPAGQSKPGEVTTESGKPEVVAEWVNPNSDPNAPGIEISSNSPRQFFRIAHVFDVAQTDPIDDTPAPVNSDSDSDSVRAELEETLDETLAALADLDTTEA
jgi:hypothetical protein